MNTSKIISEQESCVSLKASWYYDYDSKTMDMREKNGKRD